MPFGKTMTAKREKITNDSEKTQYVHPFMNIAQGYHTFRILPAVNPDGTLVEEPATDTFGKTIKGKFTTAPESEVRWLEAWWQVNVSVGDKRRFILDWQNRWKSAFWRYISDNFAKDTPERKVLKDRFGINVLDTTPVLFDDVGNPVFADLSGVFRIDQRGKVIDKPLTGDPVPFNQVRILEGSTGDADGKHLFQQLVDAADGLTDVNGNPMQIHQVTLRMKVTGTGVETRRSIKAMSDFGEIDPIFTALPRYDITSWATPWDDEVIKRLLDGEDFDEVLKEYGLDSNPKLVEFSADTPKKAITRKAKVKKTEEDEEELFDD